VKCRKEAPGKASWLNCIGQSTLNIDYVNSAHYEVKTRTFRAQKCNLEACSDHMSVRQFNYSDE